MKEKQRTEITLETHEVTIIRANQNQTATRFCPSCGKNIRHLPIVRAAFLLGISEVATFRLVENGQIHSTETEAGALLVCQNSLADLAQK